MHLPLAKALVDSASFHFSSDAVVLSAAIATILSFLAAAFVSIQGILGADVIVEWILKRSRYKTIHKTLRDFKISRGKLRKAGRHRKKSLGSEESSTVEYEIKWLTEIVDKHGNSPTKILIMHGITDKFPPEVQLYKLSAAYDSLNQRLSARALLSSNRLLVNQQEQAKEVAQYLHLNANFRSIPQKPLEILSLKNSNLKTAYELHNPRINFAPASHIDHVTVLHEHERRAIVGFPSRTEAEMGVKIIQEELDDKKDELAKLLKHFEGRDFDGVLPALREKFIQRDPFSGHLRLLLHLSEITYSAVRALNYVGEAGVGRSYEHLVSGPEGVDRLLSLSMIPVTSDGFLMLARRSSFVTIGAKKYAPAVNGNLELRDRLGLAVDRGEFGFPDPVAALAREAKEEMAQIVERGDVQVIGFSKFICPEEVSTWVLLTSVLVADSADRFVSRSRHADQIEGAWETTGEFLALPNPNNRQSALEMIRWAINASDVTPPVCLAMLAMSIPYLWVKDETTIPSLEHEISSLITSDEVPRPKGTISDFE